jgi:glycosyltransferase involved in cell wall biosynthesis
MKKIYLINSQYEKITSGPGRFLEYVLAQENSFIVVGFGGEPFISRKLIIIKNSTLWLRKYFRLGVFINQLPRDALIVYQSSIEAIFSSRKDVVFLSDDNYMRPKMNLKSIISIRSFLRAIMRFLYFFIERSILKQAKTVVVNSQYIYNSAINIYGIPKENLVILYKGVDCSFFKREKTIKKDESALTFSFVKNDWRRGGLISTIKFLKDYAGLYDKKVRLLVAGIDVKDLNVVRKILINNSDNSFDFLLYGILSKKELIEKVYAPSKFYLNFATQEALGVGIMESICAGCIPIVSGVGGMHEVVGDDYILSLNNNCIDDVYRYMSTPDDMKKAYSVLNNRMLDLFSIDRLLDNFHSIIYKL